MTHKLFALSSGKCCAESSDAPSNQEILLGGHLYLMALKVPTPPTHTHIHLYIPPHTHTHTHTFISILQEKLGVYLNHVKMELEKQVKMHPEKFDNLSK